MLAINCTKLEHEEASSKRGNVTILGLWSKLLLVAEFLHVDLKSIEKHCPDVFFSHKFPLHLQEKETAQETLSASCVLLYLKQKQ